MLMMMMMMLVGMLLTHAEFEELAQTMKKTKFDCRVSLTSQFTMMLTSHFVHVLITNAITRA